MVLSKPENWEEHYSVLRQADRDDPIKSLREICNRDSLFNQRDELFEFYFAATQSEAWEGDDPKLKSNRLFFYQTTLYLWEISCRIDEMLENGQLCYGYPIPRTPE